MTADPLNRFTPAADSYARYRPTYPAELLDWILALSPPDSRVVDLGCGTGIASRLFAGRGLSVVGVDGNLAMLRHAARAGGGPRYLRADASRLPLAAGIAHLVVSAQAFHWFDHAATFLEIDRVLAPGGWAAAFWNLRRERGGFPDAYDALLREHCKEYAKLHELGADEELRRSLAGRPFREAAFRQAQRLDWETLVGRAHSASYVANGVDDLRVFDAALRRAFDRHQQGGRVDAPLTSVVLAWPRA